MITRSYNATYGDTIIFECHITNMTEVVSTAWERHEDETILEYYKTPVAGKQHQLYLVPEFRDKVNFIGNKDVGDFTIELCNVNKTDEAEYRCMFSTVTDKVLRHTTVRVNKLRVKPPPPPPQIYSNEPAESGEMSSKTIGQVQARDVPAHLDGTSNNKPNKLVSGKNVDATYNTYEPSAFVSSPMSLTGHGPANLASASIGGGRTLAATGGVGLGGASGNLLNLLASWPYLLLIIATLLMLANVYVILALVRRTARLKKQRLLNTPPSTTTTTAAQQQQPPPPPHQNQQNHSILSEQHKQHQLERENQLTPIEQQQQQQQQQLFFGQPQSMQQLSLDAPHQQQLVAAAAMAEQDPAQQQPILVPWVAQDSMVSYASYAWLV